jgi:hypothetical protein
MLGIVFFKIFMASINSGNILLTSPILLPGVSKINLSSFEIL